MDGATLIDLLEAAGYFARSYSGRAMYGARCVGVDLDDAGELFKLGVKIGLASVGSQVELARDLAAPNTDGMGRGIIAYWRWIPWPADRSEVEIWHCDNCKARNREAETECQDCGYEREED